ncbi:MAG: hypothetical protein ACJAWL_003185 [Motiliproteus sp.]|jgi:hypothetical protein
MKDVALAPLFVIEYEGQCDAGIVGPLGVGRGGAVTYQVSWIIAAQGEILVYWW